MPTELPAEVLLHVFTFLPLEALAACHRVSSAWFFLLADHSRALYRGALALEGLEPGRRTGARIDEDNSREICRRAKVLSTNWAHGRATCEWLVNAGRNVWRLKLDEDQGTIIMSARGGGISVVDMQTNQTLGRIDQARPHAHLEFDQGFLIFDNDDGRSHEVYRRTADVVADVSLPSADRSVRGQFTHFATLISPGLFRAYRYIHPHLLIGSMNSRNAWIWDVPRKELVATIDIALPGLELINYVELTPSHIIILGLRYMSVFARPRATPFAAPHEPRLDQHVLDVPSSPPAAFLNLGAVSPPSAGGTGPPRQMRRPNVGFLDDGLEIMSFGLGMAAGDGLETPVRSWMVEQAKDERAGTVFARGGHFGFTAAHPAGPHLFLTSRLGQVHVLLEYERVFADPALESAHTLALDLGESVFNLCCSPSGAVLTTRTRVLFFSTSGLPTLADLQSYEKGERPIKVTVHQFDDMSETAVEVVSCVQMDSSKIALTYYVKADDGRDDDQPGAVPVLARRGGQTAVKILNFAPTEPVPARARAMVEERLAGAEEGLGEPIATDG